MSSEMEQSFGEEDELDFEYSSELANGLELPGFLGSPSKVIWTKNWLTPEQKRLLQNQRIRSNDVIFSPNTTDSTPTQVKPSKPKNAGNHQGNDQEDDNVEDFSISVQVNQDSGLPQGSFQKIESQTLIEKKNLEVTGRNFGYGGNMMTVSQFQQSSTSYGDYMSRIKEEKIDENQSWGFGIKRSHRAVFEKKTINYFVKDERDDRLEHTFNVSQFSINPTIKQDLDPIYNAEEHNANSAVDIINNPTSVRTDRIITFNRQNSSSSQNKVEYERRYPSTQRVNTSPDRIEDDTFGQTSPLIQRFINSSSRDSEDISVLRRRICDNRTSSALDRANQLAQESSSFYSGDNQRETIPRGRVNFDNNFAQTEQLPQRVVTSSSAENREENILRSSYCGRKSIIGRTIGSDRNDYANYAQTNPSQKKAVSSYVKGDLREIRGKMGGENVFAQTGQLDESFTSSSSGEDQRESKIQRKMVGVHNDYLTLAETDQLYQRPNTSYFGENQRENILRGRISQLHQRFASTSTEENRSGNILREKFVFAKNDLTTWAAINQQQPRSTSAYFEENSRENIDVQTDDDEERSTGSNSGSARFSSESSNPRSESFKSDIARARIVGDKDMTARQRYSDFEENQWENISRSQDTIHPMSAEYCGVQRQVNYGIKRMHQEIAEDSIEQEPTISTPNPWINASLGKHRREKPFYLEEPSFQRDKDFIQTRTFMNSKRQDELTSKYSSTITSSSASANPGFEPWKIQQGNYVRFENEDRSKNLALPSQASGNTEKRFTFKKHSPRYKLGDAEGQRSNDLQQGTNTPDRRCNVYYKQSKKYKGNQSDC